MFVGESEMMAAMVAAARKQNLKTMRSESRDTYIDANEFFEPFAKLKAGPAATLGIFVIPFDKDGRIGGASKQLRMLRGRHNLLDHMVAVDAESDSGKLYYLADWSQGIPGNDMFSPAVCSVWDESRYGALWNDSDHAGGFGCREWTAQLYQDDRPYIDVTSYSPHGSFIGNFVGWSRFIDPRKPVIGLQGKTWLCLHDCPPGEQPGLIPDMRKWTAKHHYPMPEQPSHQPLYPNSKYLDDIDEADRR